VWFLGFLWKRIDSCAKPVSGLIHAINKLFNILDKHQGCVADQIPRLLKPNTFKGLAVMTATSATISSWADLKKYSRKQLLLCLVGSRLKEIGTVDYRTSTML
jgi:hypothetical protein